MKIALTYDVAHNRPCSQPGFLVLFIISVATAHMSYGLAKLSHMEIIHPIYGSLSDFLLFTGFATRMFAAICIVFLSAPAMAGSDTMLAHLFADADMRWGFTHTEWYYFMLGDIVWCTGAVFLKVLSTIVPADSVPRHRVPPLKRSATRKNAIAMKAHNYQGRPKKLKHSAKLKRAVSKIKVIAVTTPGAGFWEKHGGGEAVDAGTAVDDEEGKTIARAVGESARAAPMPAPAPAPAPAAVDEEATRGAAVPAGTPP